MNSSFVKVVKVLVEYTAGTTGDNPENEAELVKKILLKEIRNDRSIFHVKVKNVTVDDLDGKRLFYLSGDEST